MNKKIGKAILCNMVLLLFLAVSYQTKAAEGYGIVKTAVLNIRQGPGVEYEIMGIMSSKAICRIENMENDGWYQVHYGDTIGFAKGEYLEVAKREELEKKEREVQMESLRADIIEYAKQFIGNPYVWGGTSLTQGADCSGFVQSVFSHFGVMLPRTSVQQSEYGETKSTEQALPGDLIFYQKDGTIYHVVLYMGEKQVVHASCKKDGIKISPLNESRAAWAVACPAI
ncbi:MAG: DUF1175 family protein [Clostridia bacterium]|nr:DUF1175 family protein [Clostridia bacterium]